MTQLEGEEFFFNRFYLQHFLVSGFYIVCNLWRFVRRKDCLLWRFCCSSFCRSQRGMTTSTNSVFSELLAKNLVLGFQGRRSNGQVLSLHHHTQKKKKLFKQSNHLHLHIYFLLSLDFAFSFVLKCQLFVVFLLCLRLTKQHTCVIT